MENAKKKKIAVIAGISVTIMAIVIIIVAVLANNSNSSTVAVNVIDPGVKVTVYYDKTEVSEAGYVKGGKVMIDTSKLPVINNGEMKLSDIEEMEEYKVVVQTLNDGMKVFISEANTSDGTVAEGGDIIIGTYEDETVTLAEDIDPDEEETTEEEAVATVETEEEEPEATTAIVTEATTAKPVETTTTTTKPVTTTTKAEEPVVTTTAVTTAKPAETEATTSTPTYSETEKLAGVKVMDGTDPANLVLATYGEWEGNMVFPVFSKNVIYGQRFSHPDLVYNTSKSAQWNLEYFISAYERLTGGQIRYNEGGFECGTGRLVFRDAANDDEPMPGYWTILVDCSRSNFYGKNSGGVGVLKQANMLLQALAYFGGDDFGDNLWCIMDEFYWVRTDNDKPIDNKILNKYGFTLVKQGKLGDSCVSDAVWKYKDGTQIIISYDLNHYMRSGGILISLPQK